MKFKFELCTNVKVRNNTLHIILKIKQLKIHEIRFFDLKEN